MNNKSEENLKIVLNPMFNELETFWDVTVKLLSCHYD